MSNSDDNRRRHSNASIAAAVATFTAVLAVAVAVWDNVEMRKHNRLSVLPYVVLDHTRSDSGGLTRAEVSMSNAGVGPAILHGLEIRFRTAQEEEMVAAVWGTVAPLITREGVQIRGWADVDSGTALGIQQQQRLLRIQAAGEDSGDRVQGVLDRLRLRLRYASVYGDAGEAVMAADP